MAAPRRYPKWACSAPSSASFGRTSSSKDFTMYSCVTEELQVVIVLHCFPHTRMETAIQSRRRVVVIVVSHVSRSTSGLGKRNVWSLSPGARGHCRNVGRTNQIAQRPIMTSRHMVCPINRARSITILSRVSATLQRWRRRECCPR